jgi:TonB family protein
MSFSRRAIFGVCAFSFAIALNVGARAADSDPRSALEMPTARYEMLQKLVSAAPSPAQVRVTDRRGKSMHDDVQANVLLPAAKAEIDQLRAAVEKRLGEGQVEAARETVKSLSAAVDKEVATYNDIAAYWISAARGVLPDRTSYFAYLRKNGIEPRYAAEINAARQKLDAQIGASQFGAAVKEGYPALTELMNRAAQEEHTAVQEKIGDADFVPFLAKNGKKKCSDAANQSSGTSTPRFARYGAPGEDYYPAVSRRLAEEGKVFVMVRVSAEGCPLRAVVTVSSGYPQLDAATLDLMLDSRYLPAERDGRAVPEDYFTVMEWSLKD